MLAIKYNPCLVTARATGKISVLRTSARAISTGEPCERVSVRYARDQLLAMKPERLTLALRDVGIGLT